MLTEPASHVDEAIHELGIEIGVSLESVIRLLAGKIVDLQNRAEQTEKRLEKRLSIYGSVIRLQEKRIREQDETIRELKKVIIGRHLDVEVLKKDFAKFVKPHKDPLYEFCFREQ